MGPDGCWVATRHSSTVPRSLATMPSASAFGGDPGRWGLGGRGTWWSWSALPPHSRGVGCVAPTNSSPWTASIPGDWHLKSSWDMPVSSRNIAGNVSLMRLKSAGSLENYLFMSVVDFHTSVPSPFSMKAAC